MLRELGCFFWLAILDLFACLCVVSGAEGMPGQGGGGLALVPWLLAFLRLGTVGNVIWAEKFTVLFPVFAIRHGSKIDSDRNIYRAFCRFCD